MSTLKRIFILSMIIFFICGAWFLHMLWSVGQFKTIEPHYDGTCTQISRIVGAEDITIDAKTGTAYISSCDRRSIGAGGMGKGGIYAYGLTQSEPELILLTPDAGDDFRPHGISLYKGSDGQDVLFVVNHEGGIHRIDIFDFDKDRLVLRKSLSDPMVVSPNDVTALGPDRFYVTNDHHYVSGIMRMLEEYLPLHLGNVVYYDGARFTEAASRIGYANGINISRDKNEVYVCSPTERRMHVYLRDTNTGKLTLKEKINLGTGVDNIEVDEEGDLWIGGHPKLLDFVSHAGDKTKRSPSQVIHLSRKSGGQFTVTEVYLNEGHEISGSSVAAVWHNRMLIGGVFDPKFLDCQK
jgi:arylesterase / paraoxonase